MFVLPAVLEPVDPPASQRLSFHAVEFEADNDGNWPEAFCRRLAALGIHLAEKRLATSGVILCLAFPPRTIRALKARSARITTMETDLIRMTEGTCAFALPRIPLYFDPR